MRPTETKTVITEARKVKVFNQSSFHPMKTGTRPLVWTQIMWESRSEGSPLGPAQPPAAKVNNRTTERTMPGKSKSTNWPKS